MDSMQVHKPEVRYPAQGFQILRKHGSIRHPRVGGDPVPLFDWVPAYAGTTKPNKSALPLKMATGMFDTGFGHIPVKRLLATQGARVEPIIYWLTVGDTVAVNSLKWKLAQMKYGLTGKVPDGMIFRVSSLGDEENAYPVQENFIRETRINSSSPRRRGSSAFI